MYDAMDAARSRAIVCLCQVSYVVSDPRLYKCCTWCSFFFPPCALHLRPPEEGSSTSDEDPLQRLEALLRKNKEDALEVEGDSPIASRYREKAEELEEAFSGPGEEPAVILLLMSDTLEAKQAVEGARTSSSLLVHRNALSRYTRASF